MKKSSFTAALFLLIILTTLAGCSGNSGGGGSTGTPTATPVTPTVRQPIPTGARPTPTIIRITPTIRQATPTGSARVTPTIRRTTPTATTVRPPAVPEAPTVIAGDHQLTVNWAQVTGATTYQVWYDITETEEPARRFGGNITGTTCVITGLENETTYYVRLKAKNSAGVSGFSPAASGTPKLAKESFEYPEASPWEPVNGWTGNTSYWSIVPNGLTGNALKFNGASFQILRNSYSGSNYQISVKVKPLTVNSGYGFGLICRYVNGANYYRCLVYNASGKTWLNLRRFENGVEKSLTGASDLQVSAVPPDANTWYTLTLTVNGAFISAAFTDGDTIHGEISSNAAVESTGQPGILAFVTPTALFDDFQVAGL